MNICKSLFVGVFLLGATFAASRAHGQTKPTNCTASQQAAVECFVANAVTTNLAEPRHGMTLAQFESYGFAVRMVEDRHTRGQPQLVIDYPHYWKVFVAEKEKA